MEGTRSCATRRSVILADFDFFDGLVTEPFTGIKCFKSVAAAYVSHCLPGLAVSEGRYDGEGSMSGDQRLPQREQK